MYVTAVLRSFRPKFFCDGLLLEELSGGNWMASGSSIVALLLLVSLMAGVDLGLSPCLLTILLPFMGVSGCGF